MREEGWVGVRLLIQLEVSYFFEGVDR